MLINEIVKGLLTLPLSIALRMVVHSEHHQAHKTVTSV